MGEPAKIGAAALAFARFGSNPRPLTEGERVEQSDREAKWAAETAARDEAARIAGHEADERQWKERLKRSAPIAKWEKAWDPDKTEAVQVVDRWLASGTTRHLVLFGGVGCGKSTAAAYAVKHWVRAREPVAWLMHDQLVSAVMHSYDERSPKLYPRIVIDDMGREKKPEFADALCDLLDMQGHTILITSNLTNVQFKERYRDPRLLTRLDDLCFAVRLQSGSLRAQNGGF